MLVTWFLAAHMYFHGFKISSACVLVHEAFVPVFHSSCPAEDFEEDEEDVKKFRDRLPSATLDEQLEYLEEKLEIIQGQYTGYTLKRKEKNLRQQLNAVRRQLRQQRPRNSGTCRYMYMYIIIHMFTCTVYIHVYMCVHVCVCVCLCVRFWLYSGTSLIWTP